MEVEIKPPDQVVVEISSTGARGPVGPQGPAGPQGSPATNLVLSVFGRIGAVVAMLGDYGSSLITNASGVAGATVTAALDALAGLYASLLSTVSGLAAQVSALVLTIGVAANAAALASVNGSDGARYYVLTFRDTFVASNRSSPPAVTSGVVIAHPAGGNWRWERVGTPHLSWKLQGTWFVDPVSGSDEASGVSDVAAVKTTTEIRRRLGDSYTAIVSTTITILSTLPSAEEFALDVLVSHNVTYVVKGQRAVSYSGVVSAKTDLTTAGSGACADVTASWTPANEVGKLVKDVTNGRYSWVAKELVAGAGGKARLAPWLILGETSNGDFSTITEGNTAAGATIETYTLPVLTRWCLTFRGTGGSGTAQVMDFEFANTESGRVTALHCQVSWMNCKTQGTLRLGAGAHFVNNCYGNFATAWRDYTAFVSLSGGVNTASWTNNASPASQTIELCHNVLFQGASIFVTRAMFVRIRNAFFEDLGAATAIKMLEGSTLKLSGSTLCGNGNTGAAVAMEPQCRVICGGTAGSAVATQWKLATGAAPVKFNEQTSCPAYSLTPVTLDPTPRNLTFANIDAPYASGGFGGGANDPRSGCFFGFGGAT